MDTNELLEGIVSAAREAGAIMSDAGHIRETVAAKEGHANYVTAYDKRVQKLLFARLAVLLPEARFIGEEDGADIFTEEDRHGFAFCVDPIDGTTNFMTGFRPSVTSIALLRDGLPWLGVVYNPYQDMLFTGIRGGGAFLNGKPIHSSAEPLSRSIISFGTAPYYPEYAAETFALCAYYLPRCIDLRRTGSAAWDLCLMAQGVTGLFYETQLQLWDYAAAGLIAGEAGCRLTALTGDPLPWNGPSSVICASQGVQCEDYFPDPSLLKALRLL